MASKPLKLIIATATATLFTVAQAQLVRDIGGVTMEMSVEQAKRTVESEFKGVKWTQQADSSQNLVRYEGKNWGTPGSGVWVILETDETGKLWRIWRRLDVPGNPPPTPAAMMELAARKYGPSNIGNQKNELGYADDAKGKTIKVPGRFDVHGCALTDSTNFEDSCGWKFTVSAGMMGDGSAVMVTSEALAPKVVMAALARAQAQAKAKQQNANKTANGVKL